MIDEAAGPTVDGYIDLVRIGRGGFSVVYRARQTAFDREVALKLLLADFSDEADARRFRNECAVLGRIGRHENIVDVYDAGLTTTGQAYIAMQLYPRGSLGALLKATGALPPADGISMIIEISKALEFAHDQSVIHRDIKPDNILIDESGKPGLADFGVAAVADAHGGFTRSVAFSPSHVAPETLECFEYSPSSDQYSLASTLFTLLSGRRAFEAPTEAMQIVAVTTQVAPLLDLPEVPEVAAVVHRAMSRDPADRYPDVASFATALTEASQDVLEAVPGFGSNRYRYGTSSLGSVRSAAPAGPQEAIDLTRVRERTVPQSEPGVDSDAVGAVGIAAGARDPHCADPTEPGPPIGATDSNFEPEVPRESGAGTRRRVRAPHYVAAGVGAIVLAGIVGTVAVSSGGDTAAVAVASPASDQVPSAVVATPAIAATPAPPPAPAKPKAPAKKKRPKPKATRDSSGSSSSSGGGGGSSGSWRPAAPSRPRPAAPEPPPVWE